MPIGITSDDEFQRELNRLTPQRKESVPSSVPSSIPLAEFMELPEIIPLPTRGRKNGDNQVPESLRSIIGETAVIEGRQAALDLAKDFGISSSSVSAYTNGSTSTASYDSPAKNIISHINKSRRRSIKKAAQVMQSAMEAITQDKLDYADVKDLSGIAKDMSAIIKNLEPKDESSDKGAERPQFVVFAPTFRDERSFDQITVNE